MELGTENVIAEIVAVHSRSDDFMDEWRRDRSHGLLRAVLRLRAIA